MSHLIEIHHIDGQKGVGDARSQRHRKPLSFAMFLRYGVPLTLCQLVVSALYVLVLFYVIGR